MSKSLEYELKINTTYLRSDPSKISDGKKDPQQGKCNNFNERMNGGKPTWIIEHHTLVDLKSSLNIFLNQKTSAHYMIDMDGAIYHIVPDQNRAFHAGVGSIKFGSRYNNEVPDMFLRGSNVEGEIGKGLGDMNSWSIGIENVNDAVSPFTPEQTRANIYLHEKLVTEHRMNPKNLLGHADWAPGRKVDPSPYYNWRALATASEKYDDIEHNFGVYPTEVHLKKDSKIIVSYKDNGAKKEDVEHIQKKLEELGYSVLEPDESNLGLCDKKTQDAVFSFTIRYMNETIIGDEHLLKQWKVCHDESKNQTDAYVAAHIILSAWTENHELVIGEVLDLYD